MKNKLYNEFEKALEIKDMRSSENPFILSCIKISEKYAVEFAIWLWNQDVFYHSSNDEWYPENPDGFEGGSAKRSTWDLLEYWEKYERQISNR